MSVEQLTKIWNSLMRHAPGPSGVASFEDNINHMWTGSTKLIYTLAVREKQPIKPLPLPLNLIKLEEAET